MKHGFNFIIESVSKNFKKKIKQWKTHEQQQLVIHFTSFKLHLLSLL